MNLSKLKILDVAKELQTDAFHKKVFNQIEQFVLKYQKRFYPHFKGALYDLAMDLYMEFFAIKKHRNQEEYSEADRLDISKVGGGEWSGTDDKAMATYIRTFVWHRLIDKERTHKEELNAAENRDEDGGATLDYLANKSGVSGAEDYNFFALMDDPEAVNIAIEKLKKNPEQLKKIARLYKHYNDKLPEDIKQFIENLIGSVRVLPKEVNEVKELLQPYAEVKEHKLQGEPAIKIIFKDSDALKEFDRELSIEEDSVYESLRDKVNSLLELVGYDFYKNSGLTVYFKKN